MFQGKKPRPRNVLGTHRPRCQNQSLQLQVLPLHLGQQTENDQSVRTRQTYCPHLVVGARQKFQAQDVPPVAGPELQVSLAGGRVENADRRVVGPRGQARSGVVPAQPVHAPWS